VEAGSAGIAALNLFFEGPNGVVDPDSMLKLRDEIAAIARQIQAGSPAFTPPLSAFETAEASPAVSGTTTPSAPQDSSGSTGKGAKQAWAKTKEELTAEHNRTTQQLQQDLRNKHTQTPPQFGPTRAATTPDVRRQYRQQPVLQPHQPQQNGKPSELKPQRGRPSSCTNTEANWDLTADEIGWDRDPREHPHTRNHTPHIQPNGTTLEQVTQVSFGFTQTLWAQPNVEVSIIACQFTHTHNEELEVCHVHSDPISKKVDVDALVSLSRPVRLHSHDHSTSMSIGTFLPTLASSPHLSNRCTHISTRILLPHPTHLLSPSLLHLPLIQKPVRTGPFSWGAS
jgi:hypothetical protein